ncbi:MAG: FliI/YscN family ATPase [Deltaproteobacteria bacterium]|nr:FliI/YscN family ATPase [Deltaproteobacteria bacterium]
MKHSFSHLNWQAEGKVCDVIGTIVEASLPYGRLSNVTEIEVKGAKKNILAEIVGFRNERTLLLPYTDLAGITPGAVIRGQRKADKIPVGNFLLGKVLDPFLNPLGEGGMQIPKSCEFMSIERAAPNPMSRALISRQLPLGIRALDGLLTFGEGQRLGIMAGSGVGKSVLLGMIARGSASDINVIALIGERGREVREFLERDLGPEGYKRSIIIVATSDQSPLMRIRGAKVAMAVAEHFSLKGKKVLLMMDSLSRLAYAQREIGLAIGEPPTTKGYPPSVFSLLPKLLERCGPQPQGQGSISGLFTVLVDGDDFTDPIPDAARAILDGHIHLSRSLAAKGHFPAIDISASVSRVMNDIVTQKHLELANRIKALISTFQENYDFIQLGAYQKGTNPNLDEAIRLIPSIENFLKQGINDRSPMEVTMTRLIKIVTSP